MCTVLYVYTLRIYTDMFQLILILLMVQKSQTTTWDWKKKGHKQRDIHYQQELVSRPDFWTINSTLEESNLIQMQGNFEGFPLNNALFGLVLLVEEIRLASWGW